MSFKLIQCTKYHYQILKHVLRENMFDYFSNTDSSLDEFLEVKIPHTEVVDQTTFNKSVKSYGLSKL